MNVNNTELTNIAKSNNISVINTQVIDKNVRKLIRKHGIANAFKMIMQSKQNINKK